MDTPGAHTLRISAHGRRRPVPGVEVAVPVAGRCPAPGKGSFGPGGISECGSMEFRLAEQSLALPTRISPRLGEAHIDGPISHAVQGEKLEESAIEPSPVLVRPHGWGADFFRPAPFPVV